MNVNPTGNPGMATGGMGDVLGGIIAALMARGVDPYEAACAGVYIHGLAGDIVKGEIGDTGMAAMDLAERSRSRFSGRARCRSPVAGRSRGRVSSRA